MRRLKFAGFVLLLAAGVCFVRYSFAETILLKSGKSIDGKIIERTDQYVKIDFSGIPLTYYNDEIDSINGQRLGPVAAGNTTGQSSGSMAYPEISADQLAEPPSDGIYNLGGITIKFQPPQGWKVFKMTALSQDLDFQIQFMPQEKGVLTLGIAVLPIEDSGNFDADKRLKEMLKEADTDPNIVQKEITTFAASPAFTATAQKAALKTMRITLFKNGRMINITFIADKQDFDNTLGSVNESLKTFEILSPQEEKVQETTVIYSS